MNLSSEKLVFQALAFHKFNLYGYTSGRTPAPGVADEEAAGGSPFGGLDPGAVGGVVGFLFTVALLSKLMS